MKPVVCDASFGSAQKITVDPRLMAHPDPTNQVEDSLVSIRLFLTSSYH